MELDLNDFLRPEDITPEYLAGVVDETEPRQREILDLIELEPHESDVIKMRVYAQQRDRQADIVGFGDRYIRVHGAKLEEMRIAPFHVKDAREFTVEDTELELDGEGKPLVSEAGVAGAVRFLENLRQNLQVNAILTMLNERRFTYDNGDVRLTIPFDEQVTNATDPTKAFDASGVDPYYETDLLKANFYQQTGQVPDLVLLSGMTSANIKTLEKIGATLHQRSTGDPEKASASFEEWFFNGLTFRVLHAKYPTQSGLKGPIDEGIGIVTVKQLDEDGKSPFKIHRAANKLNGRDASGPSYKTIVDSVETPQVAVAMYDNMMPGLGKRKIAQRFKFYGSPFNRP